MLIKIDNQRINTANIVPAHFAPATDHLKWLQSGKDSAGLNVIQLGPGEIK